jgi:hypothetical protein
MTASYEKPRIAGLFFSIADAAAIMKRAGL